MDSFLLILDIIVFAVFIVAVIHKWGVPTNLSTTYYLFESERCRTGWIFPLFLCFISSTAIPIWIRTTINMSVKNQRFVCLPYITLFCLLLVAITASYKKKRGLTIFHYSCAICASFCSVMWIFITSYKIIYVGLGILFAFVVGGICSKTLKQCAIFWLEVANFYAIFFTLLTINLFELKL